ncbi:hypothetical protein ANCCAN_17334 [Ancylostoma caninum]|uniref:DDE Tnp4 domain-containing protein n=1 Tax=Ancylostoma caninum TaxID=29170 RepID=A0A368FX56_ANCCA|nr:hypothetical protein ANCCAN_17334 [Ancylostoma caninum]
MTPYRENAARVDRRKRRFNKEHAKARNVVEKTFGAPKRRFWVLYNVTRIEPPKLQKLIEACVLLYNIGIFLGVRPGPIA